MESLSRKTFLTESSLEISALLNVQPEAEIFPICFKLHFCLFSLMEAVNVPLRELKTADEAAEHVASVNEVSNFSLC